MIMKKLNIVLSLVFGALMIAPSCKNIENENDPEAPDNSGVPADAVVYYALYEAFPYNDYCLEWDYPHGYDEYTEQGWIKFPVETGIPTGFFSSNNYITKVIIPASLESIGDEAFVDCIHLESVIFAEGSRLSSIGQEAFHCTGLKEIEIPASLESIGDEAFGDCIDLESVKFANNSKLSIIGKAVFNSRKLTEIEIPASVEVIGDRAFEGCNNLASVTFAEGSRLSSIGQEAFSCTLLKEIELPASLESIGDEAFVVSTLLKTVTVYAVIPPVSGNGIFDDCYDLKRIYVPSGSVDAYKAADGWKQYQSMIQAIQ